MPRLDLLHAALTGFRLTRSRPAMVGVFAILFLAATLADLSALAYYAAPQWTAFIRAMLAGADVQTITPLMAALSPHLTSAALICTPINLICNTLFLTAVWRAVMAPQQGGVGFLKLGMAEVRQFLVLLLIAAFFTIIWVVALIVASMVSALVASASAPAGVLLFMVLICGVMAFCAIAAVHLSLAGPATFERGKVQVFSAWPLSNGRLWPILAVYCLALALSMIVLLLGLNIRSVPLILATGGYEALSKQVYTLSLADLFSPLSLVAAALGAIFQALQMLILFSPAADLYRQITTGEARDAF